ncbi:MAG TPA: CDP-diacylglycerol--glycerol-3-phosphate 3-phosphatidyltransferase [Acidimicrobiales bacterium]|nr:CDP-diacylglycerol--glycerol-3-phosphate 3-phosphatidyltransferase [Acidimicrobiales bacterium]
MTDTAFGPTALATPANYITILRLLVSPVLFVMITDSGPTWAAFALWTVLCLTDGVDGFLARRHGTTRSGAFLDPLADKVLVLGALVALVDIGRFALVPVAVIAAREISISMYRSYWGRRGRSIPARPGAKVKTVVQQLAVAFALLPVVADDPAWVADGLLWVAVALTVVTGVQYVVDGRRVTAGERT